MYHLNEERINEEKHFVILGNFVCGADDPLDRFLSDNAIEYDCQKMGNTYLIVEGDEILAFYTIRVNGIQIQTEKDGCNEFEVLPMLEIARFAVNHDYQGHGLGKYVFYEKVLPKAIQISKIAAVQGIMAFVEPHNKRAITFYERVGFCPADSSVQKSITDIFNEECNLYVVSLEKAINKRKEFTPEEPS